MTILLAASYLLVHPLTPVLVRPRPILEFPDRCPREADSAGLNAAIVKLLISHFLIPTPYSSCKQQCPPQVGRGPELLAARINRSVLWWE